MRLLPLARYKITGHSMEPTIKDGSHILVNKWAKIKVGDVVAFRVGEKILVKRIKRINGNNYSVSGDNKNDTLKIKPIKKEHIIGKVIF